MNTKKALSVVEEVLAYDKDAEVEKISEQIRHILRSHVKRRGLVVAISGGIDSSVSTALAVNALGKSKVFGLLLPETDSSSESLVNGKLLAEHLGIEYLVQDIAPALIAVGCYKWRDEAIQSVFPDYNVGWKNKIAIAGGDRGRINHFNLIVENVAGEQFEKRLDLKEYLQIVAATNFKQRIRKNFEYFHADRLNYAVVGTPNRVEYDQGFFVKNGDGAADIKPIAHLYKTQVYMMARHLGLPEKICNAIPTTDTYSLAQGQDEFYYALPYGQMDIALWCFNHNRSVQELAGLLKDSGHTVSLEQANFIYEDIQSKRRTTAPLHWPALLIEDVVGPLAAVPGR